MNALKSYIKVYFYLINMNYKRINCKNLKWFIEWFK